jgi:hypothetical protein
LFFAAALAGVPGPFSKKKKKKKKSFREKKKKKKGLGRKKQADETPRTERGFFSPLLPPPIPSISFPYISATLLGDVGSFFLPA